MQPYFLPYIGYFQLIGAVDAFVVYDNIKYTKKGWINRNRMLQNGADATFSLPLRQGHDSLDIREREIAPDFNRSKLLAQFHGAYRKAPHFAATFAWLEQVVRFEAANLFDYLHHSIARTCAHLGLATPLVVSSGIGADHSLKGEERVKAICRAMGADLYLNPIGGLELYSRESFARDGIELRFQRALPFEYPQFGQPFVPWLSIADVLMFNPRDEVRERILTHYELA